MKYTNHKVGIRGIFLVLCALQAALAGVAAAQTFGTTTVQGTVYTAGGAPASGTLQLSWPAFTTAASQAVAAGRTTVTIGSDGFVSAKLAPNLGASPAGLYYTAVYHLSDGTTSTEYWVVPAASQATLAQVRAQVMPAAQAVQAVNKAYVDQSIAQMAQSQITPSGGTLTGPLYLGGDPSMPSQAATKHYVDNQVGQTLSINGGAATGPLTAVQLGAAYQADQFAGSDFGSKLQACINALNATYGGSCDARNFTGTLSMGSNVTIATGNVTIDLPCATIATSNQIVITAGTRNATLHGCASRGTSAASGNQGGTVFLYSGTRAMIQVGDPTYATDTLGFHLDNVVINTTSATAATAQAIAIGRAQELHLEGLYLLGNANQTGITLDGTGNYTGGTLQDVELTGFQTAVNAIGHQVTNGATTDWVNASTFVRLHIDCPTANGNPIAGTTGINLAQGDGNTFTGGDVEGCATALHLGANAQNNTIVGLRNENSSYQVVADAGSAYNNWMTGGTMFTGKLTDNGTRNSFFDTFHRSFNALNGDWYGSQQDATLTNHYRLGIGSGNERGLLHRYQTDSGYRWTMGLSDATAGAQYYQVLDELNNVYRLSIGQYNTGQSSSNNQTVINAAGTGAVVLNGSNNAGSGGVVFGSGGSNSATVATVDNAGNAQFNGTLRVGGVTTFTGSSTIKNQADAEIDAFLWAGATAPQKESVVYKDWNGNSQWYMVKDASNNWALNSAVGNVDSFKAYQSNNSGDTYIDAANNTGTVRVNYEPGSGSAFNIYGGGSGNLYASFNGATGIKFPGLAAGSGHNCVQIDNSGYLSNTGAACGTANVGTGSTGQIAYYPGNGTALAGMAAVPVGSGGTGATTAAGALATLGGLALSGGAMQGMMTLYADPTLPLHPATKQYTDNSIAAASTAATAAQAQASSANAAAASALSGSANDATARSAASTAQSTANGALPANGCTTTPGGNVTCPGVAKVRTTISGDLPLLDVRHPSFGGGATCDGVTDIGPALQAAVNALPNGGGEILIPGSPTPCYWANPTAFTWGSHGLITLFIQGELHVGTTFVIPSGTYPVNLIGKGGAGSGAQFQVAGEIANITEHPLTGTGTGLLGTAITSLPNMPNGGGSSYTFTPSNMNGLYPGTVITVSDYLTCTPTSVTRTNNRVTAVFPSSCHIPAGVVVTVAGMADVSFNGTNTNANYSNSTNFLASASDYVQNTLTWIQTGANATTGGGTVTGLNEDTVENVQITATTGTTATATFFRTHLATAQTGIVGTALMNNAPSVLVKDLGFSAEGTALYLGGTYLGKLENIGVTQYTGCSGNITAFALDSPAQFQKIDGISVNAGCLPWSMHIGQQWNTGYGGAGAEFIDHSTFLNGGIKMDHGGNSLNIKNSIFEQNARAAVVFDPTNYWNGVSQTIKIENSLMQDNPNGFPQCWVNYTTPSSNGEVDLTYVPITQCMVNDYFQGQLRTSSTGTTFDQNFARGIWGTHNDGKTIDGEIRGEQAGMQPAVIPAATAPITTNPAVWTGGTCTVTTGILAPDGTTTAGALTGASSGQIVFGSQTGLTPAVGDHVLFGGWIYTPTHGAVAGGGPSGAAFIVDGNGSSHFALSGNGWVADNYNETDSGAHDSSMIDDWWHPVVGYSKIISSDGSSGQVIRLNGSCGPTNTLDYWMPWMMYIPASVPDVEVFRWRTQLMHGAVPPNMPGGGGILAINPAHKLYWGADTSLGRDAAGVLRTNGTFRADSVATSPSTAPICPNGTNGAFTTTGCAGTLVPATTATLGGVKCDGVTTTCAGDGTISAAISGSGTLTTAGAQMITAANTVTGLPTGCQQYPCVVAKGSVVSTSNVTPGTIITYAVPSTGAGEYRVCGYMTTTAAGTSNGNFIGQVFWTGDGHSGYGQPYISAALNTNTQWSLTQGCYTLYADAGTSITVSSGNGPAAGTPTVRYVGTLEKMQ